MTRRTIGGKSITGREYLLDAGARDFLVLYRVPPDRVEVLEKNIPSGRERHRDRYRHGKCAVACPTADDVVQRARCLYTSLSGHAEKGATGGPIPQRMIAGRPLRCLPSVGGVFMLTTRPVHGAAPRMPVFTQATCLRRYLMPSLSMRALKVFGSTPSNFARDRQFFLTNRAGAGIGFRYLALIAMNNQQEAKVTKTEFVLKMMERTGLTKADAEKSVNSFLETVVEVLKSGDKVAFSGFGTFEVAERAAREGRNPQTGEKMQLKAVKSPKFKAGKSLKDAVA